MANRACPLCFVKVPRSLVLTRGDELACPSCHTPLELSRASRVLSAVTGLCAGFIAAHIFLGVSAEGRWVMPVVLAVLAYGVVSALVLYVVSDLVVQPKPPVGHFPQSHK
jgi:hypothetical protein